MAEIVEVNEGFELPPVPELIQGQNLNNHVRRRLNFGPNGGVAGNGGTPPPGGAPANVNIGLVGNVRAVAGAANAGAATASPPGGEPMEGGRKRKNRKSHRISKKTGKARFLAKRKSHRRRSA